MTVDPRFEQIHQIYYGTDDGFCELRPREETRHDAAHVAGLYEIFGRYEDFYGSVAPDRRDDIHLVSVVGGLYGLNLIPMFRPKEITFFDVNPHQIAFFQLIRRVWMESPNRDEFLRKLTHGDYVVATEQDQMIRDCIIAKQRGTLTEEHGRSARTFLSSWRYALDRFDLTRELLADVPVHTRIDSMQSAAFAEFAGNRENTWIYCSNVLIFVAFDLTFANPRNTAIFASYYDHTEMLDVSAHGRGPVTVHCRIPLSAEPIM